MTRYERLEHVGSPLLQMPQVSAWGVLYLDIVRDLGYGRPSAMGGLIGLDFNELWCYFDLMQLSPSPDEVRCVFMLSRAYVNEYNKSMDTDTPAPYISEEAEEYIANQKRMIAESDREEKRAKEEKRQARRVLKQK